MITTITPTAAFAMPSQAVSMATTAAAVPAVRRPAPAAALASSHTTDRINSWSGEAFGATGVTTKRAATAYVPQSRGSTG